MAVNSIRYKEGNKKNLDYKSVDLVYGNGLSKKISFASGDFVKDWYDCTKFIIFNIANKEPVSNSSSVDHFIMDGAPYESAYMKVDDDHCELSYEYDWKSPGIEYFVKAGTKPTWHELRKICGDPKKP